MSTAGVLGVMEPVCGVTFSHAPPVGPGTTEVMKVELMAPVSVKFCEAGAGPPCNWLNVTVPGGVTVTELLDVKVNEIGIDSVLFVPLKSPEDVSRIEP